ncbi:MAG: B12-binding domain-containing radical SAM protein [Candidatus Odinarchaeia archaeon]
MVDLKLVMPENGYWQIPSQPLGLYSIKKYLETKGYSVAVHDENIDGKISFGKEEIIGIYTTTFLFRRVKKIISEAKKRDKIVICGGPHTWSDPESLLKIGADAVVIGDGEYAMEKIMSEISIFGEPFKNIYHIPVETLDELPIIDHDRKYFTRANPYMHIYTSRGCPYQCSFCTKHMGNKWRVRSVSHVMRELEMLDGYDIAVVDDNFTLNPKRVKEFTKEILKRKLSLSFSFGNGIRIDTASREVLKNLKRINTTYLAYGVENIDSKVLKFSHKRLTFTQIDKTIKLTKDMGFSFGVFMIIGLPYDNFYITIKNLKWVKLRGIREVWWNMGTPYPNTEYYRWVDENGRWLINPKDYENYSGHFTRTKPIFETIDYPASLKMKALNICLKAQHVNKLRLLIRRGLKFIYKFLDEPKAQVIRRALIGVNVRDYLEDKFKVGD